MHIPRQPPLLFLTEEAWVKRQPKTLPTVQGMFSSISLLERNAVGTYSGSMSPACEVAVNIGSSETPPLSYCRLHEYYRHAMDPWLCVRTSDHLNLTGALAYTLLSVRSVKKS